jgi:hypothetical protein
VARSVAGNPITVRRWIFGSSAKTMCVPSKPELRDNQLPRSRKVLYNPRIDYSHIRCRVDTWLPEMFDRNRVVSGDMYLGSDGSEKTRLVSGGISDSLCFPLNVTLCRPRKWLPHVTLKLRLIFYGQVFPILQKIKLHIHSCEKQISVCLSWVADIISAIRSSRVSPTRLLSITFRNPEFSEFKHI